MRKRRGRAGIIAIILLLIGSCLNVFGEGTSQVFDEAGLLDGSEALQLESRVQNLRDTYDMNFLLVTTEDAQGKDSEEYADDFCMDRGFYEDEQKGTALFLIDMDNRSVWISTSQDMQYYLTDDRIEDVIDGGFTALKEGRYGDCFSGMLDQTVEFLEEGIPDGQYRYDEETGRIVRYRSIKPFEAGIAVLIALAAAAGAAVWVIGRYQMKWGNYEYPFREKGEMKLSVKEDRFVNQIVTTRRIPKNPPPSEGDGGARTTTHTSSGGGSFGGGGRDF